MLFNLLIVFIIILLCFFCLFLVIFNNFFTILVVKENIRLKLALAIPSEALIILAKEITDIPPVVAIKGLSK